MNYFVAGILVLIFALSARNSWVPLLVYLSLGAMLGAVRGRSFFTQASAIVRAMDALLAAMLPLGWSGRKTVSSECGDQLVAGKACKFCRVLCAVLGYRFTVFGREFVVLEVDHCRKSAST